MTNEEIKIFQDKITETIMPVAEKMNEVQIKLLIDTVSLENPDLPKGFGNMLYEQIMIQKTKSSATNENVIDENTENEVKKEENENAKQNNLWQNLSSN